MKSPTAISFPCDLGKEHLDKWRLTQKLIPLQKSFKNAFYHISSWKKSLRYLHTIHFSKLYDVQKSQTKALFTYFTKYTFLESNMSLSCLLITAQRRLPEYLPPFAANNNVHSWKMLWVKHFQYMECHLKEMSSELALICCGEEIKMCMVWQSLQVFSL